MGRGIPVSAQIPTKNYYQTTHVGYDLSGDPIYMDNGSETGQYDDSLPVDGVDSGYPA